MYSTLCHEVMTVIVSMHAFNDDPPCQDIYEKKKTGDFDDMMFLAAAYGS